MFQDEIIYARDGNAVLRVISEDGKGTTLHSCINPFEEAQRVYGNLPCSKGTIIVIVGAGSGYHIAALTKKIRNAVIIVIEPNHNILRHMMSQCCAKELLEAERLYFICEKKPLYVVQRVSQIQARHGFRTISVVEHTSSIYAYPSVYRPILSRLRAIASIDIPAKLRYPKFTNSTYRIVVLNSRYYLVPEIVHALRCLGHIPRLVMIGTDQNRIGTQAMLEDIIAAILAFRPDFVLTINHLGFDREGILTQFFTDIELPYASWFVDSPTFILEDFSQQRSPYLTVFVWDRDYCNELKACGFDHVVYLPLATDPGIFNKNKIYGAPKISVGFVGNSGEESIASSLAEIKGGYTAQKLVERLAIAFAESPVRSIKEIALHLDSDEKRMFTQDMKAIERAVTWMATQRYRVACVRKLLTFNPVIHGDPGWKRFVNGSARLLPELNYYSELPEFYRSCAVNFNTTSLQMKNGINQRVFDVPACGGFLITDYRYQLEDAFSIGREVICYRSIDEIEDIVGYYLRRETERLRIAEAAYKRIKHEHTYMHRVGVLIDTMKRLYG
ncbi:MAG: glycosyltransferase [Desulfobacterota bacterium]|nr:glycosyltransferase [Thermodesulfobacteriota bacterium]